MRKSRVVLSDEEIVAEAKARGQDAREALAERETRRAEAQAEYDRGGGDPFHREARRQHESRKKRDGYRVVEVPPAVSDFPIYKAPGKKNGRTSG